MTINWSDVSRFEGPSASPGFMLWTTFLRWQKGLNYELRDVGLTQPQFAILAVCAWLSKDERISNQQEIANFTQMDRMTISQVLSKLDELGFVKRLPSKVDARSKEIKVSATGVHRLKRALAVVENYDQKFFQELQQF